MVDGVSSLASNGVYELSFNLAEDADCRRIDCEDSLIFTTDGYWCVSLEKDWRWGEGR